VADPVYQIVDGFIKLFKNLINETIWQFFNGKIKINEIL
jgi:hypothetical protein